MSDFEEPARQHEIEATSATARLPGLDIEIVHRRLPDRNAEQISINLQAVPSFEAFGRLIESANPFAFWTQAMQMAWLPWLAAYKAMLPPALTVPQVDARSHFADSAGGPK